MKYENLNQFSLPFEGENRQSETVEIVNEHMSLFQLLANIIKESKKEFEERIRDDPKRDIYEDRTYFCYTLTQIIKSNINRAIDSGNLKLFKAIFGQCSYYVVNGALSIYVKKLSKKGLPSFNESHASDRRICNNENLPCVFIGPRVSDEGIVGEACLSITNGKDNMNWVYELNSNHTDVKIASILLSDDKSDNLCRAKEEFIKIKEKKAN